MTERIEDPTPGSSPCWYEDPLRGGAGTRASFEQDGTYFGSDAQVVSVKWRTMKVVLHYTESMSGPIIKPQWPLVFDLIDDPG